MGNWNLTIQAIGCHHNKDNPGDADKLANKFMADLIASGHIIESANLTFGGRENLLADGITASVSHPCCQSQVS